MPKVSIILPNYNHAPYLERRIQSILDQTYQDFELIYLDDASTDHSNEVFAKFADDPRVSSILNQTNSGSTFKQWNKGIKQAKGEYIWIAESDDYSDNRQLEILVSRLDQNPSVGLAYCQSWIVNQNNEKLCKGQNWIFNPVNKERWGNDFINSGISECSNYLLFENIILNASSVVMRREIFEKVGFADESLRLCGDWMLWARILLISDIAYVSEPLNYYRNHTETVRRKTDVSGVSIEEHYKVASYILKNIECPSDITEKTLQKIFYKWTVFLFEKGGRFSLSQFHRIYKIANEIDKDLNRRIIRTGFWETLQKTHLITPARYVARLIKQL